MMRFSSTAFALLVSFSASAQTSPPTPTKQDDTASEVKALNGKVDTLMKAMQGQLAPPKVDNGAVFASPFPVACHSNCTGMATNYCDGLGYAHWQLPETPPIQGAPYGAYAYFICYGRK